jgi:soluble lytic murein transglycosylase
MDRNSIKFIGIVISCTIITFFFNNISVFADIYRYIDEDGVMHFTNTPTSSSKQYQLFLRERPRISSPISTKKYDNIISEASKRWGVSFPLLKAIIKAESDFNPQAVSKKGAKGLMQIMPENFEILGIKDPFNPEENINAGTRYFKQLYDRFKGKLALSLAAYNAGPTAVDRYKTIPPYQETANYVERVLKFYNSYKNL